MGAPVLDVQSGDEAIVSDGVLVAPGYQPVIITQTSSNQVYFQQATEEYEEQQ